MATQIKFSVSYPVEICIVHSRGGDIGFDTAVSAIHAHFTSSVNLFK